MGKRTKARECAFQILYQWDVTREPIEHVFNLFWKVRSAAAWLMLPYLAWILFATVLNYELLRLNPEADGVEGSYAVQRIEL